MVNKDKLLSLGLEHKGQKIDRVYEVRGNDIGIIDEAFRRLLVSDRLITRLHIRKHGVEIGGYWRPRVGSAKSVSGRIGFLVNGDYIGSEGWNTYLITFRNTIGSCMTSYRPEPDLQGLLKDLIISPPVFSSE